MPFVNQLERDIHFAKHGHKFGASNADEYERMADQFMYGPLGQNSRECNRPVGPDGLRDKFRFGFVNHYAAAACIEPPFIRTFHPVEIRHILRWGGEEGYFRYQCGRIAGVNL